MTEAPLKPATPEIQREKPAYAPKLPYKWLALLALVLILVVVGFKWRDNREVEERRAEITQTYEELGPAITRYRDFRTRISSLVSTAAEQGVTENRADDRLQLASLHRSQGLYLRIPASAASSEETIAEAGRRMEPDAIGRCLGIRPTSARTLFDNGAFLAPGWIEAAVESEDPLRLKVKKADLDLRIRRDLPPIINTMNAEYFLLVIERGENRVDHPVEVFMWNLQDDSEVLSVRAEAAGVLVAARIDVEGAPRTRLPPRADSPIADDCSIAAQVKAVTGEPAQFFESEIPPLPAEDPETETGAEAETETEAETEAETETETEP